MDSEILKYEHDEIVFGVVQLALNAMSENETGHVRRTGPIGPFQLSSQPHGTPNHTHSVDVGITHSKLECPVSFRSAPLCTLNFPH